MSEQNYWTNLRRQKISRRTMLGASAKAGVGAAGLALVGCGGDDDDDDAAVAQTQAQAEEEEQAAEQQAEEQAEQAEAEEQAEQAEEEQAVAAFADVDLDATVRTAVPRDAGGLDQLRTGSHVNYVSHSSVHDSGIKFEPDTNAVMPHMVAPEFVDDVTMVATVARALFHDGSTLAAEDLVFTYERAGNIAEYHQGGTTSDHPSGWTSARESYGSQNWARSEATDERTWVVELHEPNAAWVSTNMPSASTVAILSRARTERVGDAVMDREPMGTGPYRFVSHREDTDFVFTRFDDHLNPLDHPINVTHVPLNKDLIVEVRPEVLSQIAGLEAGELDVIYELATKDVEGFVDDPSFGVLYSPAEGYLLYPNLQNPELEDGSPNPFLDVRVREAANLAVDREAIRDNLLTGTEEQPLFSGPTFGYPSGAQLAEVTFPYDPDRARALMAEAGYADGFDSALHIVIDFGPGIEEVALAVQQDLGAVGIRLMIKEYTAGEYFTDAAIRARGADLAPGIWWFFSSIDADPQTTVSCCVLPEGSYTVSPPSAKVEALARAQSTELDPAKRAELLNELFVEHAKEHTNLFLLGANTAALTRADVRWPAGAVQLRNQNHFFAVQKLI